MFAVLIVCAILKDDLTIVAEAAETDTTIVDDYNFNEIQDILDELNEDENYSFDFEGHVREYVENSDEGIVKQFTNALISATINLLTGELNNIKAIIMKIVLISVLAAVFTNFQEAFTKSSISETGFYVTYMLLMTILTVTFKISKDIALDAISLLVRFMNALLPSYFLSVAMVGNITSSAGFYEVTLYIILIIDYIIRYIIVPMINVFVIISIINNITKEEILARTAELIEKAIVFTLNSMSAIVLGFNVVQAIVLPAADSVKTSTASKMLNAVPVAGSKITALLQIATGSFVLIKNAIGVCGLIGISLIILIPALKLLIYVVIYNVTAAVVEPVSDKRIVACVSAVAKGSFLLFKSLITAYMTFFITISIICAVTNQG